jgi:hypothetical protein
MQRPSGKVKLENCKILTEEHREAKITQLTFNIPTYKNDNNDDNDDHYGHTSR